MTSITPRRVTIATLAIFLAFKATPGFAALPKVPEGFEIRLVAAVPAVQFPCQVATAPDGSLFIAEDPMDMVGPANKPIDRILLFKEGKEPVVFAEKLNAVFGMVWHDGSLYVMNMPNLTVLRDTDGDGKADQRKELFTDLGVPAGQPNMFNDHIVSGLQIGIDGYLYISVGDKGVPKATGPDGRTAQVFGGGILRCRLDGNGLEVYSSGTRNHLEPNLDDKDNLFTYDNTDDGLGWWTRVTHHIDGGYYGYPWDYHDRTDRMLNKMAEYGGGSPCGGFVYKEDVWPAKYRGRGFWAEWAKRVVRGISFASEGSSFKVAEEENFVEPDTVSDFRPLDLALSYDGRTMYIADWSFGGWNNKTEKLGRVYAVTYRPQVKTRPRGNDSDPVETQITQLDHPSFNERFRAQTALSKKGKDVLKSVAQALADSKTGPVAKRHLIWVVDAIAGGTSEGTSALVATLESSAADVRAQAARALGQRAVKGAVDPLISALADTDPTVRLQAVIALGRIGDTKVIPALLPSVGDTDATLAFSARKALRRIGNWKAASAGLASTDPKVRAGTMLAMEMSYDFEASTALSTFAADPSHDAAERARCVFLLAQGHRRPIAWDGKWWGTQPAKTKPPVKSIAWEGTPAVLASVRDRLSDPSEQVRKAAVIAEKELADPAALPILRQRFANEPDVPVRQEIAKTLGSLGDKEALPGLIAALRDAKTPEPVRDAALESIETIGSDVALKALLDLVETNALGVDKLPRVIATLGRFKTGDALGALRTALKHTEPSVRAAAAQALAKAGKAKEVARLLRERISDGSVDVRKAVIVALGSLKDRESVPAMINAADEADLRYEASIALAGMSDQRALRVYLRGLSDKSPDVRKASSNAVANLRDQAAPFFEQLAARKELPSNVIPELKKIYTRTRPISSWQVLGPLPFKAEAPFTLSAPIDLKAKYPGFQDEPLGWKKVSAANRGAVNLAKALHGDGDQAAFAYAEFESPAERKGEFAVGSDDTLTVWLNGEKVYDFQDQRNFSPEESRFEAPLIKGQNKVLIRCDNNGGAWAFSVSVAYPSDYAFLKAPAPGAFDAETFRKFAQGAKGTPERGKTLFADLKGLACAKCHAVGGQGGAVGPELSSVGAKYPKDELITAVLYPSAKISSGYEPVVIALGDGRVVTGIIKGETPDAVEVDDAEGKRVHVLKKDIDERKAGDVSLMPNGLAEGLTRQDFADLIAYLETLKDVKPAVGGGR